MDNNIINKVDDIKFLLLTLSDQVDKQNKYIKKINTFIYFIISIFVIKVILIITLLVMIYQNGVDLINSMNFR